MKRSLAAWLLVGCMTALISGAFAEEGKKEAKPAKAATTKFLVISPHTAEQCLQALDDVQAMGSGMLAKWDFGCMDGDHTGYLVVSASSAEEALTKVPESARASAKAIKLHKFSAAELKAAHEKPKS
jgi:hypothetical protein